MSLSYLQTIGISKSEGDLYELLLRLGEVPTSTIIRESKLKKPTVYKYLYTLEEKGLVTKRDIEKKIHFKPEPPTKLVELTQNYYETLDRTLGSLQASIPHLSQLYLHSTEKPIVSTYEGVEGIKAIYKDTLKVGEPIYALIRVEEFDPQVWEWGQKYYIKERARRKIHAKVIVAGGKIASQYRSKDVQQYRTTIEVPYNTFPFEHEIDIYGDKVAFFNYKKGDQLIGVVIQHKKIAQTMKAWFDLAWIGAEQVSGDERS